MDEPDSWQELNAYVDGELAADRASAMAEAIAADRDLARQAALLSRMKAGLAASAELPPSLRALLPGQRPRRPRAALAAAVAGVLLIGAAALWLQADPPESEGPVAVEADLPRQPAWLSEAIALHRGLAVQSAQASGPMPAAFPGFLPDLAAAKLRATALKAVELATLGHGTAVQYRGSRGCRVSLIALDESGGTFPESLQHTRGEGLEAFHWRVGAIDYLLLAEGMDSRRLGTIAATVHEATSRRARVSPTPGAAASPAAPEPAAPEPAGSCLPRPSTGSGRSRGRCEPRRCEAAAPPSASSRASSRAWERGAAESARNDGIKPSPSPSYLQAARQSASTEREERHARW